MSIHLHAANGDTAALIADLENGVSVDSCDKEGRTPLMVAAASPKADTSMLQVLLDHGADVNALIPAKTKTAQLDGGARPASEGSGIGEPIQKVANSAPSADSVLSYAANAATHSKIITLLEAGADVSYIDANGYSVLVKAMYRAREESTDAHAAIIGTLIDAGAPLDVVSSYGESALSVASHRGDFSLVAVLLERGADSGPLGWTPLFHHVAAGNLEAVTKLVNEGAALDQRDRWDRTPFLLSVQAGRQEAAKFLLDRGSDRSATGRCGQTALMFAVTRDDAAMLKWLIAMGWDVEGTDDFGTFPLIQAARENAVNCVQVLLDAGVSVARRNEFEHGAIHDAASPQIVRLLVAAGEDLSDVRSEMRLQLLGIDPESDIQVSEQEYRQHRHRVFGKSNPERMNNAFWDMMVRTRMSAYMGASKHGDSGDGRDPVWCFTRYGQSITQLPDGRYVEIAGEHEDHYDPDFCIYNDVVVHHGNGRFDLFGYPESVFPPTDFHSATLVRPHIYIIGNLGYPRQRKAGETPVYRLHCETWAIERMDCKGDNPGWIHGHKSRLVGDHQLAIRGGLIDDGSHASLTENTKEFVLNLATFTWTTNA